MNPIPARRVAVAPRDGSLAVSVVRFCRLLKHWGLRLPASSAQTALAALAAVDITRRYDFRTALRIALLKRPEDFQLFDYLFNAFWSIQDGKAASPTVPSEQPAPPALDATADDQDDEPSADSLDFAGVQAGSNITSSDGAPRLVQAARSGLNEQRPGAQTAVQDPAEFERLAKALAEQLRNRRSRRYERHPHGRLIDLRATLRRSLRYAGIPVELAWRRPQISRTELLIICDVSRSMREYTNLFLRFAAAVMRRVWRVEVLLFATELKRVTPLWRDKKWTEIAESIPACGGGTQLGVSLETFFGDYDHCLSGHRTTVIILSDGLDAGDPELVSQMMQRLQRQSHRIVWLNPLLRLEGYEPTARGMAAALPYLDVFAPGYDLDSLWKLVPMLAERRTRV